VSRRPLHPATPPWLARAILFTIAAYWLSRGLVSAARSLEGILVVVVISFVVASALEMPVAWMSLHLHIRRGVAAGIVLGASALFLLALILGVGVLVTHQITHLFSNLPATLAQATSFVNAHFHTHLSPASVQVDFSKLGLAHTHLTSAATTSLTELASLLAGILFTFYFVAEGPQMRNYLCSLLPPRHQPEMVRALELATEKAGGYFFSRFLLSVIRFCAALIVLLISHTPEPFALALWYALLAEFIPVVGTVLATALPVAVAVTVSTSDAVAVLIVLLVVTGIRNYLLAPKLTRHTVQLHPAFAFASVIAAVVLFGPLAGLLAVPVLASYIHRHEVGSIPKGPLPASE
jgi:predicted PurR-regulated permease PerM